MALELDRDAALALARGVTFRHFTSYDYNAFAGVCSALPMIAESGDLTLVLDGYTLEISDNDGEWETFDLRDE